MYIIVFLTQITVFETKVANVYEKTLSKIKTSNRGQILRVLHFATRIKVQT
jgi:hypothetical protein